MISIFEQLDAILKSVNESEESAEAKAEEIVKSIPINPEMKTSKQGLEKAWEKFAKYFYNLSASGGGEGPISSTDEMDLPDDFLDPVLKGKISGKMQDKEFKKNKVLWDDNDELEKLKKEIELHMSGESDDFDDFDYQDNEFGDDDADTSDLDTSDMDPSGGSGSSSSDEDKSEKDKLKDAINKAIDKLKQDKDTGSDSGSSSSSSGESSSSSKPGSESGSDSGGSPSDMDGEGGDSRGSSSGTKPGKPTSAKDKKLSDLKDAIDSGDEGGFGSAMDKLKEGEDGTGKLAGEHRGDISDEDLKSDMERAGISEEDIKDMTDTKNLDTTEDMSEEEMEKLKKDIVDGLEKKCEKRGGSALSKTIVKSAMKSKIENDEWKELLKLFLKGKSVMKGDTTKAKNKTVYGHKNHLWRGAVLPTRTYGHGEIQKIYCFVDFSGSVNQDLVYTFLGRVIDLCQELSYTDVVVYGFGERIVLPRKINGKMLRSKGKEVVLSQTWDYIDSQRPGGSIENFEDVAHTINDIRRKDKNSVFLIFGDALWSCYGNDKPPMYLKTICGAKVLDDICALTYYISPDSTYAGEIAYLKELVGLKNVITTKATSIRE